MERRWFAIGDPQTTFEKVRSILRGHELLGENGFLRDDVGLVSIGDHFDFKSDKPIPDIGRDGTNILRWLAEHPPEQVVILMGNHDAGRVMELAYESDETFRQARVLAEACRVTPARAAEFAVNHPRIPTPDIAYRDYCSFAEHQRELVQQLLLSGRMHLAHVAQYAGKPVLMTHAGVINSQVKELGVSPDADAIANALESRLRDAVDRVRGAWERGELAALDLTPLHFAGQTRREGGGLLYQRASTMKTDETGETAPVGKRRFHPRELPRGLVQVCGHTGHHKCLTELEDCVAESASKHAHGGVRTLTVGDNGVVYEWGPQQPRDEDATVYMIDIEMNADLSEYPLLRLA